MKFCFGIEHETAFLRSDGQFADFTNTTFDEFDAIVAQLPSYAGDYPQLRIGDAGIRVKRWYIEGFERFSETGALIGCVPKGIELRTTVQATIDGVITELTQSYQQLYQVAKLAGFRPVLTSYNPHQFAFEPVPPLNTYEQRQFNSSHEKRTSAIPMMTFGPDLNLSAKELSTADVIDCGKKLTFYSPFMIPFSYSSPFLKGQPWDGLSIRTFERTGRRPAARVFLAHESDLLTSEPSLTKLARVPAEIGRIEFKAFDSCGDFSLYGSLLALLKGLMLDTTLAGRSMVPDILLHQRSAQFGFTDDDIYTLAQTVLNAASEALADDPDQVRLEPLHIMLEKRLSPADDMTTQFRNGRSLHDILEHGYSNALALTY
ncbi:MAG: glutamate--cysteine ligase [Cyanobacteria bacterium P01_A01_bin.37]